MSILHMILSASLLGQTGGDLHFDAPLAKLGELRSQLSYKHGFNLRNRGSQVVEILEVEPSCGCLTSQLEQRTFKPDERGTLVLEVKPASQPDGPHTWFVKVRYRCGDSIQETRLQIGAEIRHEVVVQPTVLALHGSGLEQQIMVTDRRDAPLKVARVHLTTPLIQASVTCTDKKGQTLILLRTGKLPPGRTDEMLTIFTDDSTYRDFRIPITLVGSRSKISVTPERIVLRVREGQPAPSTLVRLRPAGDAPLTIDKVTSDDPAFGCTWAAGPDNGATLRIRVDAAQLRGACLESVVRVLLRAPVGETVVIPVRAIPE